MKTSLLLACVASVGLATAEPVVSDVLARQMWPWEKRIRVTCTVGGVTEGHEARLRLHVFRGETDLGILPDAALSGDVWAPLGASARKTIWIDPAKTDLLPAAGEADDLHVAVTAEDVGAILYKVVDLTKEAGDDGQLMYVTSRDLQAGVYGACVTNPIPGVVSLAWTAPAADYTAYAGSKLVLRRVAAGSFKMGESLSSDVSLSAFWIGVFPVTYQQLNYVTGESAGTAPYKSNGDCNYYLIRGTNVMVSGVARVWPESGHAVTDDSLVGRFRAKTGLEGLDLPTEAQWEYACRAGTTTKYFYNSDSDVDLKDYAVYGGSAAFTRVGLKKPNAWGLYDMLGGNWEWVLDWVAPALPSGFDPVGAATSSGTTHRYKRGGASASGSGNCTSFKRLDDNNCDPGSSSGYNSFRLVQNGF